MGNVKFDGFKITIGGEEYIIPPLSLGQVRKHENDMKALSSKDTDPNERPQIMLRIIHAAMTRNYPDLTVGQVEDMVDLGNLLPIIEAVMNTSGMARAAGEMLAGLGQAGKLSIPTS
jgi:hypothetical protein